MEDRLSVTFLMCANIMNELEQINESVLIAEVLGAVVYEKSDLTWVVPYTPEFQEKVLAELFSEFPISDN